ncbi:hypothetical protein ATCC90586_000566 [Pythium insidiosum]|nr:hypothetical protein ATCC90586_000566 [Pythium insidiosum]
MAPRCTWLLCIYALKSALAVALDDTTCDVLRVPRRNVDHTLVHVTEFDGIDRQANALCEQHGVPPFRCGMVLRQLVDTLHDMAVHDVSEAIVNVSLTYSLFYSVTVDGADHMITIPAEEPVHDTFLAFCERHSLGEEACKQLEQRLRPLMIRDWGCDNATATDAPASKRATANDDDDDDDGAYSQVEIGDGSAREGEDADESEDEYVYELQKPDEEEAPLKLHLPIALNDNPLELTIDEDKDLALEVARKCHEWLLPPPECRWLLDYVEAEAAKHPVFSSKPPPSPLLITSPRRDRLYPANQRVYLDGQWADGAPRDVCIFVDLQTWPTYCGAWPPLDITYHEKAQLPVGPHVLLFTTVITDSARDPEIAWLAARHITVVQPTVSVLSVASVEVGEKKDQAFLNVTVETRDVDIRDPARRLCLLVGDDLECLRPEMISITTNASVQLIKAPVFGLRTGTVELTVLLMNEYNDAFAASLPVALSITVEPSITPLPRDARVLFEPPGLAHRQHPKRCPDALDAGLAWLCALWRHEWGLYSQNGEDGVLHSIFHHVGVTSRRYVEFGAGSGHECNTRLWRDAYDWDGLLLDARHEDPARGLHRAWVTAENVNELFAAHGVPREFDLLSIDVDFNDYWLLSAIDRTRFSPRVIVIEVNSHVPPAERRTVRYDPNRSWDAKSDYFGVGVGALEHWGRRAGYSLVYCETRGVNCFLVRDDVLRASAGPTAGHVNDVLTAEDLHHPPNFFHRGLSYVHQPETPDHAWVWLDRECET